MPAVNVESRKYYSLDKDTKRVKTKENDQIFMYDAFEGHLKAIKYRPAEGDFKAAFQFIFKDPNGNQEEVFQAGAASSYIHSLIGSLDNNPAYFPIRLTPKIRAFKDRTGTQREGISMYVNNATGDMLKFSEGFFANLPQVEIIDTGGEKIAVKTKRIEAIKQIAERVSAKYTSAYEAEFGGASPEPVAATDAGDQHDTFDDDESLPF